MTSPPGPTRSEAKRSRLFDFLRCSPARHRTVAAVALALVAGAAIGRPSDPLQLHALVAISLITALLVLSDLFVEPSDRTGVAQRRPIVLDPDVSGLDEVDGMLPNCPACGLPVFAHEDHAPTRYSGASWQQNLLAEPLLFPAATAAMHANDDTAPDALVQTEETAGGRGGRGDEPAAHSPDTAAQDRQGCLLPSAAPYAGSKLKTNLDMIGASARLRGLLPLMLAISCLLMVLGRPARAWHLFICCSAFSPVTVRGP